MMRSVLGVLLILPVLSCGGGQPWQAPPARESLIPEIQADGTKFFVFQRDYLRPEREPGFRPEGRQGSRPQRDNGIRIGEFDVEERLTLIMQTTGYCRNGFFELYREQTFESFSVRGECREDATDADREQFQQAIALN
ncbi:MAG: hypothetical protein Q8S94_17390 [Pseudohongiella sp.]|nr:hypothetical protein [Pseudohongiella sp.]